MEKFSFSRIKVPVEEAEVEISSKELSERESIKEDTKMRFQHEIGELLKQATYQAGVPISGVAEELKNFYEPEEIEYLKTLL